MRNQSTTLFLCKPSKLAEKIELYNSMKKKTILAIQPIVKHFHLGPKCKAQWRADRHPYSEL